MSTKLCEMNLLLPNATYIEGILIHGIDRKTDDTWNPNDFASYDWKNVWKNVFKGADLGSLWLYIKKQIPTLPAAWCVNLVNSYICVHSRISTKGLGIDQSNTHLIQLNKLTEDRHWLGTIVYSTRSKFWFPNLRSAFININTTFHTSLPEIKDEPIEVEAEQELKRVIKTKVQDNVTLPEPPKVVLTNIDFIVIDTFLIHVRQQSKDKQQILFEQARKRLEQNP